METSHPLSIESFSYSWLVNLKPSIESLEGSLTASLDASDEASFIEMDPRMPPSKRFFRNSQDFKFDFPTSQYPLTLVDADDLFSNGYLMPLFVESLKMEAYEASDSNPSLPSSSHVPKIVVPNAHSRCPSLKRCRTMSRRIFQKYLNFLRPLCRRLRSAKSGSKSESVIKNTYSLFLHLLTVSNLLASLIILLIPGKFIHMATKIMWFWFLTMVLLHRRFCLLFLVFTLPVRHCFSFIVYLCSRT
ncbi:probable membrane-associated kinase regulator 6 [Vigna radiata var. radiata]|uniref:Probable membrane-associated kinase regulator 6 n=1 Tax=Vigna radiata var. radiata TaxID=3916 RepID=A0A3Q0EP28_VIGRR|nr:probable membrane-associated kinase regulator 6 [Vigna radiata var. radiata]